jgi:hypothetical protein
LLNESCSLKVAFPPALSLVEVLYVSLPSVILAQTARRQASKQGRLLAAKTMHAHIYSTMSDKPQLTVNTANDDAGWHSTWCIVHRTIDGHSLDERVCGGQQKCQYVCGRVRHVECGMRLERRRHLSCP